MKTETNRPGGGGYTRELFITIGNGTGGSGLTVAHVGGFVQLVQKQNKQTIKIENPSMAKGVVVEETEVFTYPTAPSPHLCVCLLTLTCGFTRKHAPVDRALHFSWGGEGLALPVFLACISRGEFCKALSTSSEVKCGRGATKQNTEQH